MSDEPIYCEKCGAEECECGWRKRDWVRGMNVASVPLPRVAVPFLKFAGGKRQLLPEIRKHVPASFGRYFEPFVGGGAVFFDLCAAGRIDKACLNDSNIELMLTYSQIHNNVEPLIVTLREHSELHSEKHYYAVRAMRGMPQLAAAARMLYLNKTCFNGLYRVNNSGGFNVPFGRYKNPTICDADNLRACSRALQDVALFSVDFASLTETRPGDFMYFDPPYWPANGTSNFTNYTAGGFGPDDQQRLADHALALRKSGVHVLLSNADLPPVRKLYKSFYMRTVQANRSINSKGGKRGAVGELLIW